MAYFRLDSPARVSLAYASVGACWILGSDALVYLRTGVTTGWLASSAKGLLFVAATTGLIHHLVRRLVRRHQEAEARLRQSQEQWDFALRSAGVGTWQWSSEAGGSSYSPQWAAMLGYTEEEIGAGGDDWQRLLHPDDRAAVADQIRRHTSGETPGYECEFRLQAKDGSYRWILSRGLIVERDAAGQPLLAFGTHTDITTHKSDETRIADALAFMRAVLQSSPFGIIAYRAQGDAAVANESAARIIGTDVPGLLRQNFRSLASWQQSGLLSRAEAALATGRETAFAGPLRTSFGRSLWLDARLVPFEYGGARHLLLLFHDATEARRNLDRLQLMHAAVQAAPVGWVVTDAAGRIESVNPAFTRITGYTAEEAVGQTPRLLRSGRHDAEFYAGMWEVISRGEVWTGEVTNRRKDGSLYHEHMTIAPVRAAGGAIAHFVAIKRDITERKELERQLARTQRLESIGMLASGIAHDLNNIFAPILLSTELLKALYPGADGQRMLDMVAAAGQRGSGIVRQILTFARGIDGERTEVQPKYVVKELGEMLAETLPRSIEIRTDVQAGLRPVVGDPSQLHQVLLNLAVNARDAMPDGGRLTIRVAAVEVDEARAARNPPLRPGPAVAFSVADTGMGIPPEVLEHMFEPFYTTKPRGKGTGLGLSTVYGIVRSHGGSVEVSTELGRGTEFTVLLPAAPAAVAAGTGSRPPMEATFDGAGRRLLVVDDEDAILAITAAALTASGFVVETATHGADARDRFLQAPDRYAAVLTDLMMPVLGGLELIRAVRAAAPALPVIISSGLTEDGGNVGWQQEFTTGGPCVLLRKPYTEPELLRALRQALGPAPTPADR